MSTPRPLTLSILDQSVAVEGCGEDAALRGSVEAAVLADQLGYARYWVSEHHNLPTIVGSAPEVLMAAIAARTSRIRIGSAGVMLPHYAAFKVAEQFRALDALAPGRIDLGLGRAPGGDRRTAMALNPYASGMAEDFPQQVQQLAVWVSGQALGGIVAHPRAPQASDVQTPADAHHDRTPVLWMLGSSDYGARLAAELGMPYAFAYFFTDGQGCEQALHLYRTLYKPSARHPRPQTTLCVWALAAPTDDEAQHLALSRERWRVDRARNVLGPLQAPDTIAARGFTADELPMVQAMRQRAFVGSAQTVRDKLHALAETFNLDELVVNTWTHDPAMRHRSMRLLAQVFGLGAA